MQHSFLEDFFNMDYALDNDYPVPDSLKALRTLIVTRSCYSPSLPLF